MQSNPFAEIALDGSLLLAAPIAVLAGLISFLSPCVLPLVPGYLGYVTGLGGDVLTSRRRGRLVLGSVLFVLGFAVVFVGITVVFTQAMVWLRRDGAWVTPVLGVLVSSWASCSSAAAAGFSRSAASTSSPPPAWSARPCWA